MTAPSPAKRLKLSKSETLDYILTHGVINVVFQPIVRLKTRSTVGWEALCRGPRGRMYSPGVLFPYAARSGRIRDLELVACRSIASEMGKLPKSQMIAVNMSADTLADVPRLSFLIDLLASQTSRLIIELTEHQIIKAQELLNIKAVLAPFRRNPGIGLAIDDVGSGYSRLRSIAELQPDFIKVDKPLVDQIVNSYTHQCVVEYLVRLSSGIGADLIAEGVETQSQLDALRKLGVGYAQGFLFGRPMPAEDINSKPQTKQAEVSLR